MCKIIKELDSIVLIIKYKDTPEEAITEINNVGIAVKAKNTILNFTKAISTFLYIIQLYFLNSRLNYKHLFLKF